MPKKNWEERFDELTEEQFFDLHYRFCPLVDTPIGGKQKMCHDTREEFRNSIKSFLATILSERDEKLVGEIGKIRDIELDSNGRYNACTEIINLINNPPIASHYDKEGKIKK